MKAAALKGGNTGPAVVANDSEQSLMVRRVLGLDGEDRMPLDEDPLPESQIAMLRAWIDQGAVWPEDGSTTTSRAQDAGHWAYRAPVRPPVPRVSRTDWARTPIDAFILARLEKAGLQPSPEASRTALLRRVSLDLIGLPPTLAEIDAFVADTRPDATTRSSIGCWPRRTTASAGRGRGSISPVTPTATATKRTRCARCGSTATG